MKPPNGLTQADAAHVLDVIRNQFSERSVEAAGAVVDQSGELMAFMRTTQCRLPSINIAINKAYTAARERIETAELGERSRAQGFPMTNFGDLRYVSWGGGVPLLRNGSVVGAVGVSGLPENDDVEIARFAAAALPD